MAIAELIIRLKDQASSGLGRIGGAIAGLTGKAGAAAEQSNNMAGAIAQGVLQANAVTYGVQKATEAIGFMNNAFNEAKNLQLEQINAASTFSSLTGQSFEQASKFIEGLNDRLSKSAAALPGATADYKALAIAVQDNVLEAFKDPAGTLNQQGFEDTLASIAESFGALTAASTRDIGNTNLGVSKALGGASIAELRSIAFFEQNAVVLNELEKRLKAMGKTSLKDLNIADRVKLIEDVGKKFITKDFKKNAGESVDGLLQSFNSTLFDPSAGIFGIMKDLDPKTEGVQSAFSSLNNALIELIGQDGVFELMRSILKEAGVVLPDPMAKIKGAVDFVVGGLKKVNEGLRYVNDFIKAGGTLFDSFRLITGAIAGDVLNPNKILNDITAFLAQTGEKIGNFLSSVIAQAGPLLNQGVAIASKFFADPGKFYELGVAFGGLVGSIARNIIVFLSQVDYPQLLIGIGRVAIAIGAAALGAIGGLGIQVVSGIGEAIAGAGGSVINALGTLVQVIGQTIVDWLAAIASPVKNLLGGMGIVGQLAAMAIDGLIGGLQAFVTGGVGGLFRFIVDSLSNAVNTLKSSVTSVLASIPGIGALFSPAAGSNIEAGLARSAQTLPGNSIEAGLARSAQTLPGAYSGHIGNAAGGFLGNLIGAAQREIARMPGGASLMMANSSETIIPQGGLGALLSAIAPSLAMPAIAPSPAQQRGGNTVTIGPIIINPASGDPSAIAQEVIARIQQQFEGAIGSQLA